MKTTLLLSLFISLLMNTIETQACFVSFGAQYQPKIVPAIYPPLPVNGGTVTFYSKADGKVSQWQWDFGDGSLSNEQNPTHTFAENKVYKVTLTAFIEKCVAVYSDTVSFIQSTTCFTDFSYNEVNTFADCQCAGIFSFQAKAESPILSYKWSFGDSTYSTDANPVHNYANKGVYWVNLKTTSENGCTNDISKKIAVGTEVCNFTIDIKQEEDSSVFTFLSPSSNLTGKKILWNFGDGTTGYGFTSTHAFANAGNYTICATLYDELGNVCEQCTTAYFKSNNTNYCDKKGIFYHSYFECKIPVIKTDSVVFAISDASNYNLEDGTIVAFSVKPDPSKRLSLICGNEPTQNVFLTCLTVLEKPVPNDSLCHEKGTYWSKYLDCTYPVIKTENGPYLVIGGDVPNIIDGTPIVFGYKQSFDKMLYTSCINYVKAIQLTCLTVPQTDTSAVCTYTGTVHDKTGLDGCGLVVELDNGTVIEPVLSNISFSMYDKQRVKLAYKELEMVSICMGGKIAEITCIEEIYDVKPDPCKFFINLTTSATIGNNECNGTAIAYAYSPINLWKENNVGVANVDTSKISYAYYWSNGETGNSAHNLCPYQVNWLSVTDLENGCTITSSFSIFQSSSINTAWTYQKVDSFYYFNIPTSPDNKVMWKFDDGSVVYGASPSYPIGSEWVKLIITDKNNTQLYSEVINLKNVTSIDQSQNTNSELKVYPVPANDVVTMNFTGAKQANAKLEIYNLTGKLMYTENFNAVKGSNSKTIQVNNLQTGIYIGKITLANTQLHFKIKKQ